MGMQPQPHDLVLGSPPIAPPMGSLVLGGFQSWQQQSRHPQPAQRMAALKTIAQSYLPRGLPDLVQALQDDDRDVQTVAYLLLQQQFDPAIQTLLQGFPHYRLFQPLRQFLSHAHPIKAVAFGVRHFQLRSAQSIALTADSLGLVNIWDRATGEIIEQLPTWVFPYGLDYDPDRDWVLIRTSQAQIVAWSLKTGQAVDFSADQTEPEQTLPSIRGIASTIVIDDRYLAFSNQRQIKIWDKSQAKEIAVLSGHRSLVNAIAVSADRQYLLSGSEDKTVMLWGIVGMADPVSGAPPA
jgi:WD40 repeat protein